jgi:plastocyanin
MLMRWFMPRINLMTVAKVATSVPSKLTYHITLGVLVLGTLLGLTACGELGGAAGSNDQAPAGGTEASPASAQTITAEVDLTEYAIQMPVSLAAGPQLFRVTNKDANVHNLEVEGLGIEETFESNLSPGESQTMRLNLEPGTYQVYCPVSNHREQGMEMQLSVFTPGRASDSEGY